MTQDRGYIPFLVGSLLLHILLMLIWGLGTMGSMGRRIALSPPEITLVPIPEPSLPTVKQDRQVVVSNAPDTNIENPNARLESDRNNVAASPLEATKKDSPLPEMGKGTPSAIIDSPQPGQKGPQSPPQKPSPQNQSQPQEHTAPVGPQSPSLTKSPEQIPNGDLPIYKDEKKQTSDQPKTESQTPAKMAPPPTPNVGFSKRRSMGEGGNTQTGLPSPEAKATELGRYKARMFNAIGSRWYIKVDELMQSLQVSSLKVRFTVTSDGKIRDIVVIGKTDRSQALETVSTTSIRDAAPLQPFSQKLRAEIGESFDEEISFGIY